MIRVLPAGKQGFPAVPGPAGACNTYGVRLAGTSPHESAGNYDAPV